jgi:outer membrane protein assembly factor BamB
MKGSRTTPILVTVAVLAALTASSARAGTDWATFGFDVQRTGDNPWESTLGTGNIGKLKEAWTAADGGPSLTQPTVATGVALKGGPRDLVFAGTFTGDLFAFDRVTGAQVWRTHLASLKTGCDDFPGGVVGILDTPTLDRARHAVYVAAADGKLHALDEASGAEQPGWPVTIASNNKVDFVYGSPTLLGSSVYVETASVCDMGAYHGRTVRISLGGAPKVTARWFPVSESGTPYAGGIWGAGGISTDGSALYAATGNAIPYSREHAGLAERVVRLSPALKVQASNFPNVSGLDVDFGATPLLYRGKACLAAMNKSGALFVYDPARIGDGPKQRLQVGDAGLGDSGNFINLPAYDPDHDLILVNLTTDSSGGPYRSGLVAFKAAADCTLSLAWQRGLAGKATKAVEYPGIQPTVANGVVYVVRSNSSKLYALDVTTGKVLWDSGTSLKGGVYNSATVANGQLLVVDYAGTLHAFGL